MSKPKLFTEALAMCCEPDLFNAVLSDEEEDKIYECVIINSKKAGIPSNFLEWRDLVYDSMEELGYELS